MHRTSPAQDPVCPYVRTGKDLLDISGFDGTAVFAARLRYRIRGGGNEQRTLIQAID
jgi:hypothetical protein